MIETVSSEPRELEQSAHAAPAAPGERLARLIALPPARRSTGALARLDPTRLSPGERIDLVEALQEQKNWLDAVQARVLAEIEAADASPLHLSGEAVSLALKIAVPSAQRKLKTSRTLVEELPRTLAQLVGGRISERHAQLITEASWGRCNGALACRRHNLCKAGTGWDYRRNDDGSFTWTDDTGHRRTGHPPQRWRCPGGQPTRRREHRDDPPDRHGHCDHPPDAQVHSDGHPDAHVHSHGPPTIDRSCSGAPPF